MGSLIIVWLLVLTGLTVVILWVLWNLVDSLMSRGLL